MADWLRRFGQATGIVSGAGACLAWLVAIWAPEAGLSLSNVSFIVAFSLAIAGIIVVIASIYGHAIVLLVLFFVSFLPVGIYLLGVPGWIRVIGICNLGYLLAGLMLWWQRTPPDGTGEAADRPGPGAS